MIRRLAAALLPAAAAISLIGCTLLSHITATGQRKKYTFEPAFHVEDVQFRRSLENLGGGFVGGNEAKLLENGDGVFPAMLEDIRQARRSVDLESYIFKADEVGRPFADAMIAAARHGVEVRLLVDAQGSKLNELRQQMTDAGVEVRDYRPFRRSLLFGRRTHRKLLVVDGKIGYTGGFCFDKRWKGDARDKTEWHDSSVRVTGPVVAQMQAIFAEDWTFTTGEILAGDAFYPKLSAEGSMEAQAMKSSKGVASSLPKMLYFMAIESARESIYIQNAYFLPDRQIREALIAAAKRGVDVKAMVPSGHIDVPPIRLASRHYFGELLRGGLRIYEYQPAMIHSKTLMVDGVFSTIGSINLDTRSMSKNAELSLSFYDRAFTSSMEAMFQRDLKRCHEVTYEEWKHRGFAARFFELVSWAFKPLY